MGTRHVLSASDDPTKGIEGARSFLLAQFSAIPAVHPLMISTEPVAITLNGISASPENVIVVQPGTDQSAGVIVIGAHYDTASSTDISSGTAPAPGANENGSGVAALVEIARIMAAEPHRATLIYVAFTAEETGLQGSRTFIKKYLQMQTPPITLRAVFNLDMIGSNTAPDGTLGADSVRVFSADPNESASRQLARQIQLAVGAYSDMPQVIIQSSEERGGHIGDQQAFSAAGDPAIRLIESVEDASRQRTPRDTIDAIQPAYLMSVTRAALAAISLLADGPDAPRSVSFHTDAISARLTWSPVTGASGYVIALRQTASLAFDQVIIVSGVTQFSAPDLAHFDAVALAALDSQGRMGALSPETPLSQGGS